MLRGFRMPLTTFQACGQHRFGRWMKDSDAAESNPLRRVRKQLAKTVLRVVNRQKSEIGGGGQHRSPAPFAKAQDASSGGLYLHITADTPGEAAFPPSRNSRLHGPGPSRS